MNLIYKSRKPPVNVDEYALNQFCPLLKLPHPAFNKNSLREQIDYTGVDNMKAGQLLKLVQLKFLQSYLAKPDDSYIRLMYRWNRYIKWVSPKIDDKDIRAEFVKYSGSGYAAATICVQAINDLINKCDSYSFNIKTEFKTRGIVELNVESHIDCMVLKDGKVSLLWLHKGTRHKDPMDPSGYINYSAAFAIRWLFDQGIVPSTLYFVSFNSKGGYFIRDISYSNTIHDTVMTLTSMPVNTSVDLSKCLLCPVRATCPNSLRRKYG